MHGVGSPHTQRIVPAASDRWGFLLCLLLRHLTDRSLRGTTRILCRPLALVGSNGNLIFVVAAALPFLLFLPLAARSLSEGGGLFNASQNE